MRQWKSLVAPSCFPQPPSPEQEELDYGYEEKLSSSLPLRRPERHEDVVRLVGCDGRVRAYRPPVTARDLMQEHPRHLVCRADALLIGEKIPAVAAGEELQPGQAYFLLPAHLFRSVLSYVSLASSLLLLLSTSTAAAGGGKRPLRPFELCRTASGTLQIKFSDDFLLVGGGGGRGDESSEAKKKEKAVLRGDERLEKEYEELVGYGKSRRWAPKLEPIQEVVAVVGGSNTNTETMSSPTSERRKSRGLPFLGRLGSRRRDRRDSSSSRNGGSAVACSG